MRRGITLIEVLFAVVIMAIGLLGLISLFVVGGSLTSKALVGDSSATILGTAAADFQTHGMDQPARWLAWNPATNAYEPFAPQFGESYCIDPRLVAANPGAASGLFPYVPGVPRMRRITLDRSSLFPFTGLPLTKVGADAIFTVADDLNFQRPADRSLVTSQEFDALPVGGTARRQVKGEYSWFATLVPKIERDWNPQAFGFPIAKEYVLSIVVCHQRPADFALNDPLHERALGIAFPGGGITGGEVLLTGPTEASLGVHTGDWICLAGVHQQGLPVPLFRWYRVADVEAEVTPNGAAFERYATLAGQDWDVSLTSPQAIVIEGAVAVAERTIRLGQSP